VHPAVERFFGRFMGVHQWVYDVSDGRVGASLGGRPMLLLRTVGRRSGTPRTTALLYVPDGDARVVFAFGDDPHRHPGWLHNLLAAPTAEIQVGRRRIAVRAHVAQGSERTRLWAAADAVHPDFRRHRERAEREIPVVVLEMTGVSTPE
jgi:deazaflavin-dependent oxidoreductase (nitroreductase family)